MADLNRVAVELAKGGSLTLSSVTDGFDAFCVADLTRALAREAENRAVALVHVARDSQRARAFAEALAFAAPDIEILDFPAWDCQPYDRVSPNASIAARRMVVLSRLARSRCAGAPAHPLHHGQGPGPARRADAQDRRRHVFRRAGQCGRSRRACELARNQWLCARIDRARRWRICRARRHPRSFRARNGAAGAARFLRRCARIDPRLRSRDRSARPASCAASISCR